MQIIFFQESDVAALVNVVFFGSAAYFLFLFNFSSSHAQRKYENDYNKMQFLNKNPKCVPKEFQINERKNYKRTEIDDQMLLYHIYKCDKKISKFPFMLCCTLPPKK